MPPYDLLIRNKGLGRTTQLCWFCLIIIFLISEMSQNVYLVNLFSGEVDKHKHSDCDQHRLARTPGRFAEVDVKHCKQHVGAAGPLEQDA